MNGTNGFDVLLALLHYTTYDRGILYFVASISHVYSNGIIFAEAQACAAFATNCKAKETNVTIIIDSYYLLTIVIHKLSSGL